MSASLDDEAYADRLLRLGSVWWKRVLDVQRPYRRHLRGLQLGFALDVGCGIGRNLINLGAPGAPAGVGVDRDAKAVAICHTRGLTVFLPGDFLASEFAQRERFDTLLLSHVLEHMTFAEAEALLRAYLPFLRADGRVVLIVPQEAGQASDPTHVEFLNLAALHRLARACALRPESAYSFPFPRPVGRVFPHNESVVIARR